MPKQIQSKTIAKVVEVLKKEGEMNVTELAKKTQITYANLIRILDLLQNDGVLMIAKVETFVGNKKITQSVNIRWIKKRK